MLTEKDLTNSLKKLQTLMCFHLFKHLHLCTEEKIALQISGTAMVLDEIINHVQSLQRQVEVRPTHP